MHYKNKVKLYLAPHNKIKMNRFLKAFCLIALITFFASCKKDDDDVKVVPPRPYGEQYARENDSIEKYLKNHYIEVDAEYNTQIIALPSDGSKTSIWEQKTYELKSKMVNSNEVDYKVYYLVLNQGGGEAPTRGDNVLIAFRGTTLKNVQFDYSPFPQTAASLTGVIEGWQEIVPMFNTGTYVDIPDNPDPAQFEDYGAGVMFIPSGLAYYNSPTTNLISAYDPLVFSFKLYALEYTDLDGDGILNKDETVAGTDIKNYDTDADGTPNYLDVDDDGDGFPTRYEIRKYVGDRATVKDPLVPLSPEELYKVGEIPTCDGSTTPIHLDAACNPTLKNLKQ
jgi:FKBP-type peptidyl-prolyl cis-trans isomerase FkpA